MKAKKIFVCLIAAFAVVVWGYCVFRFETLRLFTLLIPPVLVLNLSKNLKVRNTAISIFVVFWIFVFHYESTRYFYRNLYIAHDWPKFRFLFPPLGWIMFYAVDDTSGYVQVYGVKGKDPQPIDPHEIFRTRTLGYDNIHRGILNTAGYKDNAYRFCKFLKFRFPYFDTFLVSYVNFPARSENHFNRSETLLYQCPIEPQ